MFGTVVHLELFLENSCGIAHFEMQHVPVLLEQIDGLVTREDGKIGGPFMKSPNQPESPGGCGKSKSCIGPKHNVSGLNSSSVLYKTPKFLFL